MSATVQDVMTTEVVSVAADTSFKQLAAMFRQHRVSAFPVVSADGKVLGVVSEADLLPREALLTGIGVRPGPLAGLLHRKEHSKLREATVAGDLMSVPPITISPEEPVTHAARIMYSCRVKRLPVVDAEDRLVGIVSRADVLTVYSRPDQEIAQEITQGIMLRRFFTDPGRFTVTVKDGIVTLEGTPETTADGHGIVAESWHVEGVVSVRDRLRYPTPPPRTEILRPVH